MFGRFARGVPAAFSVLLAISAGPLATRSRPEVHFSPHGGCTAAIVHEIDAAKSSVLVEAYKFNSRPIADALLRASRDHKVQVEIVLDGGNGRRPNAVIRGLLKAGIPLQLDDAHRIAHNKVMVIDGVTVITGSFTFTSQAEGYAENVLVLHDPALAADYDRDWRRHAGHLQVFPDQPAAAKPASSPGTKTTSETDGHRAESSRIGPARLRSRGNALPHRNRQACAPHSDRRQNDWALKKAARKSSER